MSDEVKREQFERLVLGHMDAAYNLARWLVRNEARAEDAVQEAYLRAFKFFGTFRGEDARPWLLGIVRNVCYTILEEERRSVAYDEFDEGNHGEEAAAPGAVLSFPVNPETALLERAGRERVQQCLRALPDEYREVLILREIHECSYREIAAIANIPIGTVMSRLARGRQLLQRALADRVKQEDTGT